MMDGYYFIQNPAIRHLPTDIEDDDKGGGREQGVYRYSFGGAIGGLVVKD